MPRSFLIKKKDKGDRKGGDGTLGLGISKSDFDLRPVLTEPMLAAVAPYSPLVQPLAVRFYNGYFHDMLSALPYYDPMSSFHARPMDLSIGRHDPLSVSAKIPPPSPDRQSFTSTSDQHSTTSDGDITKPTSPKSTKGGSTRFQDGVTVGYTYDAFFISDGRSRKRSPLGMHDSERPRYSCSECGKQYATSSNLSRHKQTHRSLDSQQAKKCPHCNKVYVSMPALSMHILTHNLRHQCTVCDKSFSRPWLLQGHMRSHSGEKPYGCAHCGKAFADRSNLRAHMQTHSSYKNYACKRCDKSFALKSYLNKHYESSCFKDDISMSGSPMMSLPGSDGMSLPGSPNTMSPPAVSPRH